MTIKTLTKLAVNSRVQAIAIFLLLLLPFFIASFVVLSGSLPFWYDPARDFLLAWDNLSKVTLIGPVTGIPGIFYGPYWIWLISMGLLISKDPKITVFLIQTIPYILILPGIFLLQKNFSRLSLASVWLLFMFGTGIHYATMPWNPHIAPIFLIFIFLLIAHINLSALHQREYRSAVLLGVLLGLVVNVHISFGVVAVLGTAIYLLTSFMTIDRKKRKKFTSELFWSQALFCLLTTLGLLVTFTPFFLFEIRHNFIQTKSLLATLTANHPVVGLKGLSHQEIIRQFFLSATQFVGVGQILSSLILLAVIILFFWQFKKNKLQGEHLRILAYGIAILLSALTVYLSSQNPIWAYHFIGVDVVIMFVVLVLIQRHKTSQLIILATAIIVTVWQSYIFFKDINADVLRLQSLKTKEVITQIVKGDAGMRDYTVFIYSPAIYTYDYSYLFRYLAHKDIPYDPGQITANAKLDYVIVSSLTDPKQLDFINYKTSNTIFTTTKKWVRPDGSIILRREPKSL